MQKRMKKLPLVMLVLFVVMSSISLTPRRLSAEENFAPETQEEIPEEVSIGSPLDSETNAEINKEEQTLPIEEAREPIRYSYSMEWANEVSSGVVDYSYDTANDPNQKILLFHPKNQQEKAAIIRYRINIENDANTILPANSISIRVPAFIFVDWQDGNTVYKANAAAPSLKWQLPKAPETTTTSDFHWKDNEDGTYTVTNFKEISGGSKLSFEQAFNFVPHLVKVDRNGMFQKDFTSTISFDINQDGINEVEENKNLSIQLQTQSKPMEVVLDKNNLNSNNGIFFTWQTSWGEKPNDAEDYFYIVWDADVQKDRFSLLPFNYDVISHEGSGELIGVKEDSYLGFVDGGLNKYTDPNFTNITQEGFKNKLINNIGLSTKIFTRYGGSHTFHNTSYFDYIYQRFSLLKRYPKSLLEDAKSQGIDLKKDGLPIENQVSVVTNYANGEKVTKTSNIASTKVFVVDYTGTNRIWKTDWARPEGRSQIVGPITFLESKDTVPLKQKESFIATFRTEYEGSYLSEPIYNSANQNYQGNPYTSTITEGDIWASTKKTWGIGDIFENSLTAAEKFQDGDITYQSVAFNLRNFDAIKSDLTGWSQFDANSYERSGSIDIHVRYANQANYQLYGSVSFESDGSYTFRSADGALVLQNQKGKAIPLPENVSSLRYKHTSEYFSYNFAADTLLQIHATDNVKRLIADKTVDSRLDVSTSASFEVSSAEKTLSGNTHKQPLNISTVMLYPITPNFTKAKQQSSLIDNANKSYQEADITIWFGQSSNLHNSGNSEKEYLNRYVYKEGNIYDLLPAGTSVDKKDISLFGAAYWGLEQKQQLTLGRDFQVEMIENWEGTGQTMMKIHYIIPDEFADVNKFDNHGSRIILKYRLRNTYNNISDRGTSLVNTAALEILSENVILHTNNGYNDIRKKQAFEKISENNREKWLFTEGIVNYNPVTVLQSGVSKKVANPYDNNYELETSAYLGDNYSYRLSYVSSSDTRTKNIVFYDILENGNGTEESEWKGQFDWIDVSAITQRKSYLSEENARAEVYYSTIIPSSLDIEDRTIWTNELPADKSSIKAIAIDVKATDQGNPFILDRGMGLHAYIHMKAPVNKDLSGKYAVNNVTVSALQFTGETPNANASISSYDASAKILLKNYQIELHKNSSPESGTKNEPAVLINAKNTPLVYRLSLINQDSQIEARNILLEDTIPTGLKIDTNHIVVSSKSLNWENQPIEKIENIQMNIDGQKLQFIISSLGPKADISFEIPTMLVQEMNKHQLFINTAYITKIGNIKQNIESKTTYHKVEKHYRLDYVVQGDPVYGIPNDSFTPFSVDDILFKTNYTLHSPLVSISQDANGQQGRWYFKGWKKNLNNNEIIENLVIEKDETVYGQWLFVPSIDYSVEKIWHGINPDYAPEIHVSLLKNGEETGEILVLNQGNRWEDSFTNLASFSEHDSTKTPFLYSIKEVGEENGEINLNDRVYSVNYQDGKIINTLKNPKIQLKGQKIWDDNQDQDRLRPNEITVHLLADGEKKQTITTNKEKGWRFSFENLDTYNQQGGKIVYLVQEDEVEGYQQIIEGAIIHNIHKPATTSISIKKNWQDNNNQRNLRPQIIIIRLFADGKEIKQLQIRADEKGLWSGNFFDLPVYKDGKKINYTLKEDKVNNYVSEITKTDEGFELTNKLNITPRPVVNTSVR